MKIKKQKTKKEKKKPEKKAKRNLSNLKKLILQKLQSKKTTLDTKLDLKTEVKEERKVEKLETIASHGPDFGVSRPVLEVQNPTYQPREVAPRAANLERTAFEQGVAGQNRESAVYGASTELYNRRQTTKSNYASKGDLEKDISHDIVLNDSIRREVEFDPERFIGYKTDIAPAETAYRRPEDIDKSIKTLEESHMEDFINKKEEATYNPNRVMAILEKDKKEFDQKYKRGMIK